MLCEIKTALANLHIAQRRGRQSTIRDYHYIGRKTWRSAPNFLWRHVLFAIRHMPKFANFVDEDRDYNIPYIPNLRTIQIMISVCIMHAYSQSPGKCFWNQVMSAPNYHNLLNMLICSRVVTKTRLYRRIQNAMFPLSFFLSLSFIIYMHRNSHCLLKTVHSTHSHMTPDVGMSGAIFARWRQHSSAYYDIHGTHTYTRHERQDINLKNTNSNCTRFYEHQKVFKPKLAKLACLFI